MIATYVHCIAIDMFVQKNANKEKRNVGYNCDKIFTADMLRYENFIQRYIAQSIRLDIGYYDRHS